MGNAAIFAGAHMLALGMMAAARAASAAPEPEPKPEPPKPELEKPRSKLNRIALDKSIPPSVQLKAAKAERGSRIKYLPHQGSKEVQRRLKQEAKRAAKEGDNEV